MGYCNTSGQRARYCFKNKWQIFYNRSPAYKGIRWSVGQANCRINRIYKILWRVRKCSLRIIYGWRIFQ
jgi:hypothetical protein